MHVRGAVAARVVIVIGAVMRPARAGSLRGITLGSDRSAPKKPPNGAASASKVQNKKQDMGSALRSVYQRTVEEKIPPEMLDLLGKLG
jgi:hypothetical protein